MRELADEIARRIQGSVTLDEPMSRHTTVRVGGPAAVFVSPSSEEDVATVLRLTAERECPCFILGNGSNLLVADHGLEAVVLRLGPAMSQIHFDGDRVTAQAGASLPKLAKMAADRGLAGLEFGAGIPGTVGGAVAMNAGAHQADISSVLLDAHLVDREGRLERYPQERLAYCYRSSLLVRQRSLVAVAATFRLQAEDPEAIRQRMRDQAQRRRQTQPLGTPSSGSVFKNPPGDHAGRLIELAGLKGLRCGGAEVSTVHGNFIINRGGASARDILHLIDQVRQRVQQAFGVSLELEVELVGLG